MGSNYEVTLRSFAEGKRLGRLAKAVREPEVGVCDACGLALPRTLFGLKDTVSGRCYFVGQNCLAWLLQTGLVARARYRQSAETAYRREMEIRRNGAGTPGNGPSPGTDARVHRSELRAQLLGLRRTALIVESDGYWRALVRLGDGRRGVSGRAVEPCWRQEWARQDGALILEPVSRPRPAALVSCVLKAYGQALALWRQAAHRDERNEGSRPLKG
jgi:hypothetical protein